MEIFGSSGDVYEEEEDEEEEDLLPASFGKYPAHPKKVRAAPLSALGGPETIFLGTGCAEPSKYRAASARFFFAAMKRRRSIEIVDFTRLWRRVFRRHATVFRSRGMSKRAEDIENDLD